MRSSLTHILASSSRFRVLSPALFAMLVLMAVVTTVMTSPILHALTRRAVLAKPAAAAVAGS